MNYTISYPIYQSASYTNIVPDICAHCILYPIDKCGIIMPYWRRCRYSRRPPKEVNVMPASKAQQRAVSKYMKENYDEIKVRVEKGQKDIIKAHAEARGESVNGFIGRAIDETMERDKAAPDSGD